VQIEEVLKEKVELIDKAIEKYLPRAFKKDSVVFLLDEPKFAYRKTKLLKVTFIILTVLDAYLSVSTTPIISKTHDNIKMSGNFELCYP
jgi:hypothetical protein